VHPATLLLLLAAQLLPPTGPHPIGRITFEWRDARVHLFYPVRAAQKASPAPYHPQLEQLRRYTDEHFQRGWLESEFGESWPALQSLRGHALDRPAAARGARFPVVVFSHGGGIQVLYYSALHEELASHGYVVAAIERPRDAEVVLLSDGRAIEQQGWGDDTKRTPAERAAFHRARHEAGARDNSFVLDQLQRVHSGTIRSPLKGRLDLKHVAAAGHSLGGKTSVVSCARDPRWSACVNLDGGLDAGEQYPATGRPVLAIFGGPSPVRLPIETEEAFLKRRERNATFLESPSHRLLASEYANVPRATLKYIVSPGMSHFAYYDLPRPEAEPWGDTPERHAVNLQLIRDDVRAFLDRHLKPGI
jgi:dienelactone hydrolase